MLISTNEENRVYLPLKCLYAVCVHRIDFDLSKQSASGPIITAGSKKGQRDISEEFSQGGGATPWASPGDIYIYIIVISPYVYRLRPILS